MESLKVFLEQAPSYIDLLLRLIFNSTVSFIILHFVYQQYNKKRSFVFNLFIFNLVIFGLSTILTRIELSVGSGFGLFAIFTMMRYRSEQINMKDMAYLLIMIGLGFINSANSKVVSYEEILTLNLVIAGGVYALERTYFTNRKNSQKIKYDKIELLKPKFNHLLKRDLSLRLGKEVLEVKTENVNFIEGYATLKVYYGEDYHLHIHEDGDQIILDHNKEIKRILEERKKEINLPRIADQAS
ncbi:MAG: DUF4956 domain-containing protein [Cyclobacteriaceae bacterium]|nr:DUF4956 domain-containing protein [Cyclobacteriaceae bacterium]